MSSEQEELVGIAAVRERRAPPGLRDEAVLCYCRPLQIFEIEYHHVVEADLLVTPAVGVR